MGVDEIDVFQIQSLQTRIHSLDQMLPTQTAVVDRVVTKRSTPVQLCANDKVVPFPAKLLDGSAHTLLAFTAGITLSCMTRSVSGLKASSGAWTEDIPQSKKLIPASQAAFMISKHFSSSMCPP